MRCVIREGRAMMLGGVHHGPGDAVDLTEAQLEHHLELGTVELEGARAAREAAEAKVAAARVAADAEAAERIAKVEADAMAEAELEAEKAREDAKAAAAKEIDAAADSKKGGRGRRS